MSTPSPGESLATVKPLDGAIALERAGRIRDAIARYERAIREAEEAGAPAVLAEALRRLAVLKRFGNDVTQARALCRRSLAEARAIGHDVLAAEALNTLGGLELTHGSLQEAHRSFVEARQLGAASGELCARVEQNLGILANIQGDLDEAQRRYRRSLEAYHAAGDQHGCAIAYHNLGMVSADHGLLEKAERYFRESRELAERTGDVHLRGLCLVNQAEVEVARQRFEHARQNAELALTLFDELGANGLKADAYRVIGMIYRETGREALAEARLRQAIELAAAAHSALDEAEARRELALLFGSMGRNLETLQMLGASYRLFKGLDARRDLVDVGGKLAQLEGTYLNVVRIWGESIESADSSTFGHCERVARTSVAIARALELDDHAETTVMLGAYLHDVGMTRVPHEILRKPSALTAAEQLVVQRHPVWGVELLAELEFPWDIKPIIRWHHERCDGSGYPDRLVGDEIPLGAQIVGIAEAYDALTAPRGTRRASSPARAAARLARRTGWWSPRVIAALQRVASATAAAPRAPTP